ncbi:hypothetical protein J4Q44_G00032670 [Coregonus suidteri]|uniref:Uncharacterized protein n=1 Tax=Coregonus suidteri TaxID=861788 RepID=A0AAN8RH72_9TELE
MGSGFRCNQYPGGFTTSQSGQKTTKRSVLQMMPCTVSQLLSAMVAREVFSVGDIEVNQVSVVGIVRRTVPSVSNVLYSVDDMTGPPLDVKLWVETADPGVDSTFVSPGTYVKVSGSLRIIQGQRSLVAFNLCCLEDLNEITSHMLEVVQAHMQHNRNLCGGGNAGDRCIKLRAECLSEPGVEPDQELLRLKAQGHQSRGATHLAGVPQHDCHQPVLGISNQ